MKLNKKSVAVRCLFIPVILPICIAETIMEWIEENSYSWFWSCKSARLKLTKWLNSKFPIGVEK